MPTLNEESRSGESPAARLTYVAPSITELGDVRELTLGNLGEGTDAFGLIAIIGGSLPSVP
jgi:hypothetical protein